MDYQALYQFLCAEGAEDWAEQLPKQLAFRLDNVRHGNLACWKKTVAEIPQFQPSIKSLCDSVTIGTDTDISKKQQQQLEQLLQSIGPWRKGPYDLYGIHLDTEWRSDWKWARVLPHITSLKNRRVLDVGCGNGYHCWRMLGEGARWVLGVDPYLLNIIQFQAINKLYGEAPVFVLPMGLEDLPQNLALFDTVFSMGVLYHRRSPIDHLLELKSCLRPGGELVLETLVIEGGPQSVMLPSGRYANMRNVWFIPSCDALMVWLERCGFQNIRLCDVNKTSFEEQRRTSWMPSHSLKEFLDPDNSDLTIEGLPAPVRAIITANKV
jgi:tRNA (mo5U34)-methyltransferase